MNKEKELIDKLIDLAFAEDIGDGDHTTLSCIPATAMGKSKLLIKEAGVLAGIEVAKEIFNRFDPTMKVEVFINDGTEVKPGDVAMVVEGKVQSLLQTERLMLNVMQRMSGIATMTRKYAKVLGRYKYPRARYPQDNSRYAYPRKNGSENWWWSKPSYWFVRHDSSERQSCGLCRRYRQSHHSCQKNIARKKVKT